MDDQNPNPPPPPTLQNPPVAIGPAGSPQHPSLAQHQAQVPGGTGTAGPAMVPDVLAAELSRIPPPSLARLKQDLGLADKDVTAMTREEKIELLRRFRHGLITPVHNVMMQPGLRQETRILRATGETSTKVTLETLDAELDGIPPPTLAKLKRRLGMAGEDVATMTPLQKMRLMRLFRDGDTRARNGLALAAPNTGTPFGLGPAQVLPAVGVGHNALYQPTPPQPPVPPTGMTGHPGTMLPVHHAITQPTMQQHGQTMQDPPMMLPESLTADEPGLPPLFRFAPLAAPTVDIRTRYYAPGAPSATTTTTTTTTPAPRTAYAWGPGVAGPSTAPNPNPDPDLRGFDAASCRALLNEMTRNSNVDFSSLNEAWRRGLAMARTEGA